MSASAYEVSGGTFSAFSSTIAHRWRRKYTIQSANRQWILASPQKRHFDGNCTGICGACAKLRFGSGTFRRTQWTVKPAKVAELLSGRIQMGDLSPEDVTVDIRQKGVDMRIGVDVSSLAFKKQVDQIVLIAGDADFVPAAKQARREGIDFILDPMWQPIPPNLNEHIDGLRSTCPQQQRRAVRP
ncbi:NYN domain-containing protein [Paraburkholderia silvatlantica]|nr:NYN domain-containing protein [Paraburkholderia silvatlantica]